MTAGFSMRGLRRAPLALAAALLAWSGSAAAIDLKQAYDAALRNDPTYRAAFFANEAGKENINLGKSNLLPSVNASVSGSKNKAEIDYPPLPRREQDYIARSQVVQVRQPLFSLDAAARYKQGKAQTEYAAHIFSGQAQELIVRVATAYLDVLLKQDALATAKVERDMYAEQRKVNDLLLQKGEGTRTDALETQSRLDLAEAQVLQAQDELNTARDTLTGIIGGDPGELVPLRAGFRMVKDDILSLEDWRKMALANNPDIKALNAAVEIASQEVNKAKAGHTPRIDLTGTYAKNQSDSTTTINQETVVKSVGFQLNIPLYQGGAISASVRQSVANRSKAEQDLQAQIDKVVTELRRSYNAAVSSVPRIDALVKAVDSARLLVTATEQSIKGGVRINLDLLDAQRQLSVAQRDLANVRYNYLVSVLRLHAAAGTLDADDVRMIAAYFGG